MIYKVMKAFVLLVILGGCTFPQQNVIWRNVDESKVNTIIFNRDFGECDYRVQQRIDNRNVFDNLRYNEWMTKCLKYRGWYQSSY